MNTETLTTKLYWMQYDVYAQMDMGNEEPVQSVEIEMADGSTEIVTITSLIAPDMSINHPLSYRMFRETNQGYKQIHWEHTAWYRTNVLMM